MKKEYRKRKGSDTWHLCKNCHEWPDSNYEKWCGKGRPSNGELCDHCLSKERNDDCDVKTC